MQQIPKPKVSINILGYNSKKYIKQCLKAVFVQTYPNIEVIYIDNGSRDGSVEEVKNQQSKIENLRIVENKRNLGYAEGYNIGISKSLGEYILCLNPDVILDKNFVQAMVSFFEENKKVGAACGKLLKLKTNKRWEKTNIIDSTGLLIFKSHRVVERGGEEKDIGQYNQSQEIFGVSGAVAMFRREALESVKLPIYFDKDFLAYKEDIDLSFRLRHAGWRIYYNPSALAWHDRWETGSAEKDKISKILQRRKTKLKFINYLSYRNHLFFILKNEWMVNLLIYFPWIFWYELKKFLYVVFFEPESLKAWLDLIVYLPLTLRKRRAILSKSKFKPKEVRGWLV